MWHCVYKYPLGICCVTSSDLFLSWLYFYLFSGMPSPQHTSPHTCIHAHTNTDMLSKPQINTSFKTPLSFTKTWEKESLHAAEPRTSLNNTNEEMMVLRETAASLGLRKAHSAHSTQAGVSEGWVLWPWLVHSWSAHSCGGELFPPPSPTGSQKVTLYRQFSV